MADSKICPGCGNSVSMLDSVCPHCGTTIPETKSTGADAVGSSNTANADVQLPRTCKPAIITAIVVVLLFIALIIGICFCSSSKHKDDGYYQDDSGGYYYRYGDYWYYGNDGDWEYVKDFPDSDCGAHFIGRNYDPDWGVSNFKDSEIWENFHSSYND